MKSITFILSLIVFLLAITPCTDAIGGEDETSISHSAVDSHDHSSENEDDCTPFCTCDCCGASVTVPIATDYNLEDKSDFYSYLFHYGQEYFYDYSKCLWHPPTVC